MQISGVICLDIASNGMCVMERVGSAGEIHIRPADRLKTCGFEHGVRYPNALVRHRGGKGAGQGSESGSRTMIPIRDSTPNADRSAIGLSKRSPAAMNVERRIG